VRLEGLYKFRKSQLLNWESNSQLYGLWHNVSTKYATAYPTPRLRLIEPKMFNFQLGYLCLVQTFLAESLRSPHMSQLRYGTIKQEQFHVSYSDGPAPLSIFASVEWPSLQLAMLHIFSLRLIAWYLATEKFYFRFYESLDISFRVIINFFELDYCCNIYGN
jgi:hypothetical protein